ncbi:MAG TPA: hypothetical protein VHA82_19590 [Ramlibacter sp.]|uniref:hypothetical protein n=1 Tax=Ramlibacter sp. TaxID=1917967 RepID=UPI002C2C0873|nr:hypothetical protein [Ramlibacter sp.]HVZ46021.1 hypothetical protein [Ramlibacter sp.]
MKRVAALFAACLICFAVLAQSSLAPVTVSAMGDPVEKSYRRMLRGMDLFERMHARAPGAHLRYKLLPRKPGTPLEDIHLAVIGHTFSYPVPVVADHTFTLTRDERALAEDAVVSPERRRLTMTWRTDIRTPGLPPATRRLGDLRLECLVGIEAGLVSNTNPLMQAVRSLLEDAATYCGRRNSKYLFFADRPIFSVTLVAGARREVMPIDQLYAGASDDPGLKADLPFCDCEMLVDRTYFLPLGDESWPDDTLVQFEWMQDAP